MLPPDLGETFNLFTRSIPRSPAKAEWTRHALRPVVHWRTPGRGDRAGIICFGIDGRTTPKRLPNWATVCEARVFVVFAVFFILYGVTPILGGDGLGLVGADEPRYAQIAHEMLVRFDSAHTLKGRLSACVTPYLYGHPWLEKPALYYWRAMFVFQDFGVHDWSARLPSATFAFIMVALIYLHMRRFRRGGHLDAALITVACAGIIGFSRGASTDMQMAAPFCIGLLGWYAWYETDSKFWLFDIYFFTGVATLAKGPVAPFLAILIILCLRRAAPGVVDSSSARSGGQGVLLYFAIVLPWFVAVQHENPTFFREFFLEHNLERFATNRYEHQQPVWYYVVVVGAGLMPWTVVAIRALVDGILTSVAEWRLRHSKPGKPAPKRPGDAFPEFLVLWALIPIVFFSFSAIQTSRLHSSLHSSDHHPHRRLPVPLAPQRPELLGSSGPCAAVRISDPQRLSAALVCRARGQPCRRSHALAAALLAAAGAALLILIVVHGFGVARLRLATTGVLIVLMFFLYGFGPFFGIPAVAASKHVAHLLDRSYSARPLAERLAGLASGRRNGGCLPRAPRCGVRPLLSIATTRWSTTKRPGCPTRSTCWWRASPAGAAPICTPRMR